MQIPGSKDDGPSLGTSGLMSVREKAGYDAELNAITVAAGRAISDSLRGLGTTMTAAGGRLRAEEIRLAINEERTAAIEALLAEDSRIGDEIQKDATIPPVDQPDGRPGLASVYRQRFGEAADRIHDGLSSDAARFKLRAAAAQMAHGRNSEYRRLGAQRLADSGAAQLASLGADAIRRASMGDESGAALVLTEAAERRQSLVGVLPEDVLARDAMVTEAKVSEARFEHRMNADPTGGFALNDIREHPEDYPGLDFAKAEKVAQAAGRDTRLSALFDRWDAGQAKVADLDASVRAGDLTATQRRSLIEERKTEAAKAIEARAGLDYVRQVYAGDASPLPDDKDYRKAVDRLWDEHVAPSLGNLPTDQKYALAATMAGRLGHLPKGVRDPVGGDLSAFTPRALEAARFIATLRDVSPGSLGEFTTEQQAHANAILTLSMSGNPDQAVERAKALASRPEAVKDEQRKMAFAPFKSHADFAQAASGWVAEAPGMFGTTFGPTGRSLELPPAAVAEARQAYETAYAETGLADAAQRTAAQVLASRWSYSEINGAPEMVRFAPERLAPGYPVADMRADVMREVVTPRLSLTLRRDLGDLSDEEIADRVRVEYDAISAHKEKPDFGVSVLTDDGPVPIGRWRPDAATSPTGLERRAAENAESVEDAKARREWNLSLRNLPEMIARSGESGADLRFVDQIAERLAAIEAQYPVQPGEVPLSHEEARRHLGQTREAFGRALLSGIEIPKSIIMAPSRALADE